MCTPKRIMTFLGAFLFYGIVMIDVEKFSLKRTPFWLFV